MITSLPEALTRDAAEIEKRISRIIIYSFAIMRKNSTRKNRRFYAVKKYFKNISKTPCQISLTVL